MANQMSNRAALPLAPSMMEHQESFDWNTMAFQHIATSLEDKVLTIMINRPEARNAWTEIMRQEIIEVVVSPLRNPPAACACAT